MKNKSIFSLMIYNTYIWIFPVSQIIFSIICCFTQTQVSSYPELNYLLISNNNMQLFLFYIPILLIILIPINSVLENDLLCVRCKSHLKVYEIKVMSALKLTTLVVLIKLINEIVFSVITNSQWVIFASADYVFLYLIQFGTIFFTFLVYYLFREITTNSALAVLMYLFIFGLDFLLSMLPINGVFYELNLFCAPMSLTLQYVVSLFEGNPPNYVFHIFYMMSKIISVIIITCLLICRKRREHFVKA